MVLRVEKPARSARPAQPVSASPLVPGTVFGKPIPTSMRPPLRLGQLYVGSTPPPRPQPGTPAGVTFTGTGRPIAGRSPDAAGARPAAVRHPPIERDPAKPPPADRVTDLRAQPLVAQPAAELQRH